MPPTTIKHIFPFYNNKNTAPLPFPPMLTNQLELFSKAHCLATLLANEALSPAGLDTTQDHSHSHSTPAPKFRLAQSPKSPYPLSKKVTFQHANSSIRDQCANSPTCEFTPSTDSSSEDGSVDGSTLSTLSDDSKIPKPVGEPGCPGCGGYNLETALDWSTKAYSKFKKHVHRLIDEHLDVSKCVLAQNPTLLKIVCDKVSTLVGLL
ncbi:hypothetical protein L210DRAFT_868071 [Boletus edulis BED1]|uniref:Uncharacterized protein n=1 Tax=Boletus edulis BED1 TaxID=1328754 RepID=A0AAD4GLE8_BOLED|nr:hypothetical protein L210DRAFT_868071 [Boletus edulis BED1]